MTETRAVKNAHRVSGNKKNLAGIPSKSTPNQQASAKSSRARPNHTSDRPTSGHHDRANDCRRASDGCGCGHDLYRLRVHDLRRPARPRRAFQQE